MFYAFEQNQQRDLTVRYAKETESEMKKRVDAQRSQFDIELSRRNVLIDQVRVADGYIRSLDSQCFSHFGQLYRYFVIYFEFNYVCSLTLWFTLL